jgi:hypothetical protein
LRTKGETAVKITVNEPHTEQVSYFYYLGFNMGSDEEMDTIVRLKRSQQICGTNGCGPGSRLISKHYRDVFFERQTITTKPSDRIFVLQAAIRTGRFPSTGQNIIP